ncbi:MAG: hypothetical protein NZ700_16690, partial [Gemmataceae bacterium]|nr:hypothetical protein [Gemmataceae bacterium]
MPSCWGWTTAAWGVGLAWLSMTALALGHVALVGHNVPFADEWEFIPAAVGAEPLGPWLWRQHNEHRLPLPRLVWWLLFQGTRDFRTGMYAQVVALSALAACLSVSAARRRGRAAWSDLFFPMALLHWGHHENLRMGYQINFVMFLVLAAGLLLIGILRRGPLQPLRDGLIAAALAASLMLCGAAGLPFGVMIAGWLLVLVGWGWRWSSTHPWRDALVLFVLAIGLLAYPVVYFADYHRPPLHPPSAGVLASAWVGLQVQTMAFGDVRWSWPISGVLMAALAAATLGVLTRVWNRHPAERARVLGVAFFLVACGGMAFFIGWGRSGFDWHRHGLATTMGLWSRYGFLALPFVLACYFGWLEYGGARGRHRVPAALCLGACVALVPNMLIGYHVNRGVAA